MDGSLSPMIERGMAVLLWLMIGAARPPVMVRLSVDGDGVGFVLRPEVKEEEMIGVCVAAERREPVCREDGEKKEETEVWWR